MSTQILLVILLAFLINLITTLSYSVRIVGIRTGRIAISFSLFNILVLISRTAYGFQAPLLANTVEKNIKMGVFTGMADFQWIIFASTIATIIGGFLIPSFQRLLSIAVLKFSETKSVPKIFLRSLSKEGVYHFKESLVWPKSQNLKINFLDNFPWKVFLMNVFAVAILTIGVLSSIYAGYLNPDFRSTASSLSAIINGMATILMFVFIDPFLSSMTDDVVLGKCSEATFRRYIVYMVIARVVGTVLSQILLLPSAHFIVFVARLI
jgi:Alternate to MurJ